MQHKTLRLGGTQLMTIAIKNFDNNKNELNFEEEGKKFFGLASPKIIQIFNYIPRVVFFFFLRRFPFLTSTLNLFVVDGTAFSFRLTSKNGLHVRGKTFTVSLEMNWLLLVKKKNKRKQSSHLKQNNKKNTLKKKSCDWIRPKNFTHAIQVLEQINKIRSD